MPGIVSNPDPEEFSRPLRNGHAGDLLVADIRAYEPPLELSPALLVEQTRILDEDLTAFLVGEELFGPRAEESHVPTQGPDLLPGFEALTWADLRMCPSWCTYRGSETHADAFDSDPGNAPHRSAEHVVHAHNGGKGIDCAGRAEVTVQLERDRHLSDDPTIVLSVVVDGIEQYAWLTLPEAHALNQSLGRLTSDAED